MSLYRFLVCLVVLGLVACSVQAQEVVNKDFDGFLDGPGQFTDTTGHGRGWQVTNDSAQKSAIRVLPLPISVIHGRPILVNADIFADQVSTKPLMWNGIKLMAHIEFPGGEEWPQADIPVGTYDWRHTSVRFQIPDNATAVTLILGLEKVTGTAKFAGLTVTLGGKFVQAPPAPAGQPLFKGHDLPRLRGTMVPTTMSEADLDHFTEQWNGNLIRWQLVRFYAKGDEVGFAAYDQWLDGLLEKTDLVISRAAKRRIKVVLDLHSPPGGKFL